MNERLPALTARGRSRFGTRRFRCIANFREPLPPHPRGRPYAQGDSAVHGGDLKRGTLRGIIAQAGMTVAEFLSFL